MPIYEGGEINSLLPRHPPRRQLWGPLASRSGLSYHTRFPAAHCSVIRGLRRRTKCEEAYTSGVHDLTRFWAGGRRPGKP